MDSSPDTPDWSELERWFERLEGVGADERERLLSGLAESDPRLSRRLRDMTSPTAELYFDELLASVRSSTGRATLAAGSQLGRYHIQEELGRGGMGVVYRAHDSVLDRDVALKFLPSGSFSGKGAAHRFLTEARAAGNIDHPAICTIYEIDTSDPDRPFITMPVYDGVTVREMIREGPVSHDMARTIVRQAAEGLRAAHAAGVVHRDIKPSNLLVRADGQLKILDFGIAKMLQQQDTTGGTSRAGTVGYMSPEQATGQPTDQRTDLWSLGVVLFEMLSGRRPWQAPADGAVLHAISHEATPALPEGTPADLSKIVQRCLQKSPAARFASAQEIVQMLSTADASSRQGQRVRWIVLGAVLVALAGLVYKGTDLLLTEATVRLAVLPFEDLSSENRTGIGLGLTSDILTRMGGLPGLELVRGRHADREHMQAASGDLGVGYFLDGQVQQENGDLQVAVQLMAPDGRQLWSRTHRRQATSLLDVQGEIATAIADALALELTGEALSRLRRAPVSARAQDLYLSAMAALNERTPRSLPRAAGLFQQAVALEPDYADAWSGLAIANLLSAGTAYASFDLGFTMATHAANEAIGIDPQQALAYTALASVASEFEWDTDRADNQFAEALRLNPNLSEAHHLYASHLAETGRLQLALEHQRRAMLLDPVAPIHPTNYGQLLFYAGQHTRALSFLDEVVAEHPGFYVAHLNRSYPLLALGRWDDAIKALEDAEGVVEPQHLTRALKASALAWSGRTTAARVLLKALEDEADSVYVAPPLLAQIHIALGDTSRALDQLEQGFTSKDVYMTVLKPWPFAEPVRDNPRFQRILADMDRG
ncbi:MAG: protein kinase [Rhodothermales bacterium]|nr:protein kinase [Rhodothermales bacterium]MBO6781501.1 protein kinase [Rhodothermales bacterium]